MIQWQVFHYQMVVDAVGGLDFIRVKTISTRPRGGNQDANCEAPERTSPTSCRSHVYHTYTKILFRLKRFRGTKCEVLKIWGNLKRFLGTIYSKRDCQCSQGCRRRSMPTRSGAAQFARWAQPSTGHETISEEHNVTQAAGGGTQDANCEAPERTSPTS